MKKTLLKLTTCAIALILPYTAVLSKGPAPTSQPIAGVSYIRAFHPEDSRDYIRSITPTTTTTTTAPVHPVIYVHHPVVLHKGYPTAQACVAATENGGDYGRSKNPSHFGRYQFDYKTWIAYGGDPATWGHASQTEQDAVFARAVAAGDLQHGWLIWDGC